MMTYVNVNFLTASQKTVPLIKCIFNFCHEIKLASRDHIKVLLQNLIRFLVTNINETENSY